MQAGYNKGQSMYELVVAIAIVALALLAFVGLVISSLSASTYTRTKSRANHHTQEAMEWLRTQKDENWVTYYSEAASHGGGGFCIGTLDWVSNSCPIPGTNFERRVYFTVSGGNTVDTRVAVVWSDGLGQHTSETSTTFTDWRAN